MMKHFVTALAASMLLGCSTDNGGAESYRLQGAWTLRHVEYPIGGEYDYPQNGTTFCRIYDGDSAMYECRLSETESGLVIMPNDMCDVTVIEQGDGVLYMEGDNPRPLTVKTDFTIVIQRNGVLYTWRRADDIFLQWGSDIRDIVRTDLKSNADNDMRHYVLSAKERQQENVINWFTWFSVCIIIAATVVAQIAVSNRREKRRLRMQLEQIQEVQKNRPQAVRQAVKTVESEFFASEEYRTLQQRIATGQWLKEPEWADVEAMIRSVWPGFCHQLRTLYPMSELEYKVCLLIRLHIPPTDIAAVLAREASTISTVRSRLYKKVFGRKGSTREWDEFVLSIGV